MSPIRDAYVPRGLGRRRSCQCGACKTCKHRRYMRDYLNRPDGVKCRERDCSRRIYTKGLCNKHWQFARVQDPAVRERRREQARAYIASSADYREHRRKYKNHYRKTNLNYRISDALRARLRLALKRRSKVGSAVRDLGCSIEQFVQHLESRFTAGMSWRNWSSRGWHIDHVKPLAVFDLRKAAQLRRACHYSNLQPMWASENCSKSLQPMWARENCSKDDLSPKD